MPRRVLSPEEKERIWIAYRTKPSYRGVARQLGVAPATVRAVVKTDLLVPVDVVQVFKEMEVRSRAWDLAGVSQLNTATVQQWVRRELNKANPDLDTLRRLADIGRNMGILYGISSEKARLLNEQATTISQRVEEITGSAPKEITAAMLVELAKAMVPKYE